MPLVKLQFCISLSSVKSSQPFQLLVSYVNYCLLANFNANISNSIVAISPAGFNVETVEYKNISFTVWDVGGQDKVSLLI